MENQKQENPSIIPTDKVEITNPAPSFSPITLIDKKIRKQIRDKKPITKKPKKEKTLSKKDLKFIEIAGLKESIETNRKNLFIALHELRGLIPFRHFTTFDNKEKIHSLIAEVKTLRNVINSQLLELKDLTTDKHVKTYKTKDKIKPIDAKGKDLLHKFLGRNEKRVKADSRSRFFQLRIQLKEVGSTKKVDDEINSLHRSIDEKTSLFRALWASRHSENKDILFSTIKVLRNEKRRITRLLQKRESIQIAYQIRFAIFKELFNSLSTKFGGFGIDLNRQFIFNTVSVPFQEIQYLNTAIKNFLNCKDAEGNPLMIFKTIKHREEIAKYKISTMQYEKFKIKTDYTLFHLFRYRIHRESKNNKHHLRQVSASNLMKFESLPTLQDLVNENLIQSEFIGLFNSKFNEIVNWNESGTVELQNELTIHNSILLMSKRYEQKFGGVETYTKKGEYPANEYLKDIIQDCFLEFTMIKPAFQLTDKELMEKIDHYFDIRHEKYINNQNKSVEIEASTDSENLPILNIPFHLNVNTAYQMEQMEDFKLFRSWIESRKFIKQETKEIMLFVLDNLNLSKKEIITELDTNKYYFENAISKLKEYAKRFNELSIYEFLMKKYYPSYEGPKILKAKSVKRLKSKQRVIRTIGQVKERIKEFNYILNNGNISVHFN